MIVGDEMIKLKYICVFCLILFMTSVNCTHKKTYPDNVERACYCLCIENWGSENDAMPTAETERMCKEGLSHCSIKDSYDEADDKTPFLQPIIECPSYHFT